MTEPNAPAVLFDLDGTLVDSLPGLLRALNLALKEFDTPPISASTLRAVVSGGAAVMIRTALAPGARTIDEAAVRHRFLSEYEEAPASGATLFDGFGDLLAELDACERPWGIVTNKLARYTAPLLRELALDERAGCVVYGDTTDKPKPDPSPLLHACELLKIEPANCLYIGDARSDVQAATAAGMRCVVACWGYLSPQDEPANWQATGLARTPAALRRWLEL